MRKITIYSFLLSCLSFIFLSYLEYNYDFKDDGYSFSHDRDIFPQSSKIFIDNGVIINSEKAAGSFPEGQAWSSHLYTWDYPNGFPVFLSTISMLSGFNTIEGLFISGFAFLFIFTLTVFNLSNRLSHNKKISLLAVFFLALTPTVGSIHGNLTALPSTISFLFLLNVLFLILRFRYYSTRIIFLTFMFSLIISLTHRPTNYVSLVLLTNFLAFANTRLKSFTSILGLFTGLFVNSIYTTNSDSLTLFSLPKFINDEFEILLLTLVIILSVQVFNKMLNLVTFKIPFSKYVWQFFKWYSIILTITLFVIFILAVFFNFSVSGLLSVTRLDFFVGTMLIIGFLFIPAILKSIYELRSELRLLAIMTFLTVIGGSLTHIDPESQRLLYYSSIMLVFFYARFTFTVLCKKDILLNFFLVFFISVMIFFNIITSFGIFGLQTYESGRSYNNSIEVHCYISLINEPGEEIIIAEDKLVSKVGGISDTREFDFYVNNVNYAYYLEKGVPDLFIYRNFKVYNLDDIVYENRSYPFLEHEDAMYIEYKNPAFDNPYYYRIYETKDIVIYDKI